MKVQYGTHVLCSGTRRESVVGFDFSGQRNVQTNTFLRGPTAQPVPRKNRRVTLTFSCRREYQTLDQAADAMQGTWDDLPDSADLSAIGGAVGSFGQRWFYKNACLVDFSSSVVGVSAFFKFTFAADRMDRTPRATS